MGLMEDFILEELLKNIGIGEFQLPRYFDRPIYIGDDLASAARARAEVIDSFLDTVIALARESLRKPDRELVRVLFSEPISGMDEAFHRDLPDCCWCKPVFFRTDESVQGEIFEIQAPGSGWGDVPLYAKALQALGHSLPDVASEYCAKYAESVVSSTGRTEPRVYHMLDAASAPAGMRYLFTQTRPMLRYWGLDRDVSMHDVEFVSAHSAASLVTSNYFGKYLVSAQDGQTRFGIAPNLLFDQKAIYLLPFYRKTARYFSDEMRGLFPFTTMIEGDGFYGADGSFVSIADFVRLSKGNRRFFLKYGGPDLTRNWGSRSVFRLSGGDCGRLLAVAKELAAKGEIWLLQEDVSQKTGRVAKDIEAIMDEGYHVKLSVFYAMREVLGTKIMARRHFKVHGQHDTYAGLCL